MPSAVDRDSVDVIVIGAGFSGCYLLRNLRKHGFTVRVFDEGNGIGGVWWHNRYPGARVDTNVPCYEFSDPEIWKRWNWAEEFPSRADILEYFRFVDQQWDLSRDITFGAKVTDATFDADTSQWRIQTDKGHTASARYLIPAMGFSAKMYIPNIPGLRNFDGFICHTARWPEETIDLAGKRIGVIGTGATGVQIIQELGPVAGELHVFQRSPNCTLPMQQKQLAARQSKQDYKQLFQAMKRSYAGFSYTPLARKTTDDTPEQRHSLWEALWEQGGFAPTYANYADVFSNLEANHLFYNFWRNKVRQRITREDPELIENLAPTKPPFPFGTKRPSLEQAYYEVFNQDNVHLINLVKNPIQEIKPSGVLMRDGTFAQLDALILATGFDAVTGSFKRMQIRGLKNKILKDEWAMGARTYLGMTTSGFPNMLYLYGPQSPLASAVGPVISEIQCDWIINLLCHMRTHQHTRIDVRHEVEQDWADLTNDLCSKTLLPLNESTWYMGGNIPGKTREALTFVGGLPAYQKALEACVANTYSDFLFS